MRPQSCKAKGRRFQQFICKALHTIGAPYGLEPDDLKSTSMGANGVDCQLSPAAREVLGDLKIECKNVESLNVVKVFLDHCAKYATGIPLLFHSRNHTEPMVTMRLTDFSKLLEAAIYDAREYRRKQQANVTNQPS